MTRSPGPVTHQAEVDIAHQVLTRYHRLVVMGSGNTARAANWRRMILSSADVYPLAVPP